MKTKQVFSSSSYIYGPTWIIPQVFPPCSKLLAVNVHHFTAFTHFLPLSCLFPCVSPAQLPLCSTSSRKNRLGESCCCDGTSGLSSAQSWLRWSVFHFWSIKWWLPLRILLPVLFSTSHLSALERSQRYFWPSEWKQESEFPPAASLTQTSRAGSSAFSDSVAFRTSLQRCSH